MVWITMIIVRTVIISATCPFPGGARPNALTAFERGLHHTYECGWPTPLLANAPTLSKSILALVVAP
jgi:hypothetical protein